MAGHILIYSYIIPQSLGFATLFYRCIADNFTPDMDDLHAVFNGDQLHPVTTLENGLYLLEGGLIHS